MVKKDPTIGKKEKKILCEAYDIVYDIFYSYCIGSCDDCLIQKRCNMLKYKPLDALNSLEDLCDVYMLTDKEFEEYHGENGNDRNRPCCSKVDEFKDRIEEDVGGLMVEELDFGVSVYKNFEFAIRVVSGQFVGLDVAACLGYKYPSNAVYQHVSNSDKRKKYISPRTKYYVSNVSESKQNNPKKPGAVITTTITIEGVLSLVKMKAHTEQGDNALRFYDWLKKSILPMIQNKEIKNKKG